MLSTGSNWALCCTRQITLFNKGRALILARPLLAVQLEPEWTTPPDQVESPAEWTMPGDHLLLGTEVVRPRPFIFRPLGFAWTESSKTQ